MRPVRVPYFGPTTISCHFPIAQKERSDFPKKARSLNFCSNANVANRGASYPRPADASARDATELLRGGLGRGRGLLFHHGGSATAASTAIATIAATVAAAMATAVATVMTAVATIAAVAATIAAAAATATTMTEGHRLVVTTQEGDTNDREKDRETENNNTVHSQILQKYLQVPVSQNYQFAVRDDRIATTDGSVSLCDPSFTISHIPHPSSSLLSNSTGCERCSDREG